MFTTLTPKIVRHGRSYPLVLFKQPKERRAVELKENEEGNRGVATATDGDKERISTN